MVDPEQARNLRQSPPNDIAARFDQLVERWAELVAAQRALAEFRANTEEPQPPQGNQFEKFAELVMYNNERGYYEQQLKKLDDEYEKRAGGFEAVAKVIKVLLPERYQVTHNYGGSVRDLQGTYSIRHDPARPPDEASRVVVVSRS